MSTENELNVEIQRLAEKHFNELRASRDIKWVSLKQVETTTRALLRVTDGERASGIRDLAIALGLE